MVDLSVTMQSVIICLQFRIVVDSYDRQYTAIKTAVA